MPHGMDPRPARSTDSLSGPIVHRHANPCRRRDIVAQAYRRAVADLEAELKITGHANLSPGNHTSIQDVLTIVEKSKQRYDDSSKEHTGARKWLEKLSDRIMYYGKVLDVLAQHHPEYVALAWGAVKLVLTVC